MGCEIVRGTLTPKRYAFGSLVSLDLINSGIVLHFAQPLV
jgi:hypothetical protein